VVGNSLSDPPWTPLGVRAELIEQAAWLDFFAAAAPSVIAKLRPRSAPVADGLAFVTPDSTALSLNCVLGLGVCQCIDDAVVDEVASLYASHAVDYAVHPVPVAVPARGPEWWGKRGFQALYRSARFIRAAGAVDPVHTGLRIEVVFSDHTVGPANLFGSALARPPVPTEWVRATVGRPGWSHYLAYDRDRPVACAVLFAKAPDAWLGPVSLLSGPHRPGAEDELVGRAVLDAQRVGCSMVATLSEVDAPRFPAVYSLMLRTGFVMLYDRPALVPWQPGRRSGRRGGRLSKGSVIKREPGEVS
jgi:hypothetical protein